ncbi:MAG: PH domain-containing protein [Alphaproteobacteria bacterium]|nr:PH domain-containing protein [Alphaproteobacteria bacterium]
MSYVIGTLSKDEQIKEVAHLHWINYITVILCLALAILCIALCFKYNPNNNQFIYVIFGAPAFVFTLSSLIFLLRIFTTEMVVTNKRVVCRTGVISVHTEELKIGRIESVEIKQSILGRILGYGSLWFSGTGTSKVVFPNITDPRGIKSRMEDVILD